MMLMLTHTDSLPTMFPNDGVFRVRICIFRTDPDYPTQQIVTVDLVAKAIVKTASIKDNKNIAMLAPVPC